jgi:hypothetical protein
MMYKTDPIEQNAHALRNVGDLFSLIFNNCYS